MTPQRIQLSRVSGFRLQAASLALNGRPAVKVDRTTRWGNPFRVGHPGGAYTAKVETRRHAWQLYASAVEEQPRLIAAAREFLAGKNLACWCPLPAPGAHDECHAAVLLVIANPDLPVDPRLAALMGLPWD